MSDNNSNGGSSPEKFSPHSVEAEEAVLGSILINPDAILEIASFLQSSDFFIVKNAWVFDAILAVSERGEALDTLTVTEELRSRGQIDSIGGPAYILYLSNNTPTHIHAETYGRIVERAAVRRRLLAAASDIAQAALQEDAEITDVIDHAESTLFAVTERRLRRDMIPIKTAASEYWERIEYLYNHQDEPLGLPTGFTELDKLLGGLQRSDLLIIAARPGVGKTSFMLSLALNAARLGNARVAIFSMEMSTEQLVQRFISAETSINSQKLRLGNLNDLEWGRFTEAIAKVGNQRIYIDDTPAVSIPQMRTKSRRLYREHGLDLILVDYLQLMSGGLSRNENRVQEISSISRGLKELAREMNVPILAAAQLSRAVEQRQDKRPQLSDLRESGCLAGDTLVYLPQTGEYKPIRELAGQSDFCVSSLNPETWKVEQATVSNAFCTGVKPVYRLTTQLGRTIRATANHKFLTICGWKRLDELTQSDLIAVPEPSEIVRIEAANHEMIAAPLTPALSPTQAEGKGDLSYDGTAQAVKFLPSTKIGDGSVVVMLRGYSSDSPFPSACVGARAGVRGAVSWDKVASIEPDGESDVYDLTVPGLSNFVANNIIVHNSIEQDSDIVMFIYRDEMYNENTDRPGQADILVSKHRNGPTGIVTLFFNKELTQFTNPRLNSINLREI